MTDLTRANESWLTSPTHQQWLRDQGQTLVDFAKAARVPSGFAALDTFGRRPDNAPADTITTARMVHSFALAHIQGLPGCAPLIDHGLAALAGPLRDAEHGGWFASPGALDGNTRKDAYLHAFVALAASSAAVAGRGGSAELLGDAVAILEGHFWSGQEGTLLESFASDWSDCEAYRGAKEAIDVLLELQGTAQQINVVVSDIEMSEMDGYALTRTLRETPDFKDLYVLLHTSLDSAMNSEKARLAGADSVLTKFSSPELTKCLVVAAQTVAQKGL